MALINICEGQVITVPESAHVDQRPMRIHYELPKTEYLVAEPIFLTYWLENLGDKKEYYCREDVTQLEISDEQGRPLKYKGARIGEDRSIAIDPRGSTKRHSWNILDGYGEGQWGFDLYVKPGTYTLAARGIRSDTVILRVVWPTAPEDSVAADELTRAIDNAFSLLGTSNQQYQFFSAFVRKHPNSVYTPRALRRLLILPLSEIPMYSKAEEQGYCIQLISKFPSSDFIHHALLRLDPTMIPQAQREYVLEGLKRCRASLWSDDLRSRVDELVTMLKK
jgi:hypothetical protein